MNKHNKTASLLWSPSQEFKENARLTEFQQWLEKEKGLVFADYHELWEWSSTELIAFWESVWQFFKVQAHTPYDKVLESTEMPDAQWFTGASLNYAEHVFRKASPDRPAILFQSERQALRPVSWSTLEDQTAKLANWLRAQGVEKGDRVAAFLPNIPEATIAFLATCSIGAVWSSCSPDFGADSVVDRFQQIEPKVLFVVDGYQYNGKPYDKTATIRQLEQDLPSLKKIVLLPYLDPQAAADHLEKGVLWETTQKGAKPDLRFEAVAFDHPIWVLYSSGTTGRPKAITHGHGGMLLEHLKYLALNNDLHAGERFFWFSTTGWMMWNIVQGALLHGATAVLYDGSPAYPDLNVLWELCQKAGIHHFGTSAPYLVACMKKDLRPGNTFDLSPLRSIGSTGAPLPPEAFDYVYDDIKKDLWLCSMSGGTDVCSAFVGGCPTLPVYQGEIQCRSLGCALYAFDEDGKTVENEVGEMVITAPMPNMPIYFWGDPDHERYQSSYFDHYPGIWRHGDWVIITPRKGLVILGRSDATLNRHGIRIGTAEIYRSLNKISEIKDSLIVNLELEGGRHYMPLFVMLNEGQHLTDALKARINAQIRTDYSPRHVPDDIIAVQDIPYTISGKKLEAPVKKILMGMPVQKAANPDAMRNPESLAFFINFSF